MILQQAVNGVVCDPPRVSLVGSRWVSAYYWTATVNLGFSITQGDPMRSIYYRAVPNVIPPGASPWKTVAGMGLTLVVWNQGTNTVELIDGSGSPGTIVGIYSPPPGWQGDIAFVDNTGQGPNTSDGWNYSLATGTGVVSNQVPPSGTISSPIMVRAGSKVPVAFQILAGI